MTQSNDGQYTDLLEDSATESRLRLIRNLDRIYRTPSPPRTLDTAFLAGAHARATRKGQQRRLPRVRPIGLRLGAVSAVLALIASSAFAYFHGQSPTPVSAQTVVNRAVTAGLTANQVTHFVYRLTSSDGYTGTSDVWIQADASGAPSRVALTDTLFKNGTPAPNLDYRLVDTGDTVLLFQPASATATISPQDNAGQPWTAIFMGTRVAWKIDAGGGVTPQLVQATHQHGKSGAVTLTLAKQTLDGATVYAMQMAPGNGDNTTFYIDAQSYVLQGADWSVNGVAWQARLTSQNVVSATAVPANTFSMTAPPGYRLVQSPPDQSDYPVDFAAAFAAACHANVASFQGSAAKALGGNPLAICRQTDPGITAQQLVAAVSAQIKAQLDAAVAAGKITSAQAADELARIEAKLRGGLLASSG